MDDAPALALEGLGLAENFKGSFGAEPRHAPRQK
jgi:hypothetical protein